MPTPSRGHECLQAVHNGDALRGDVELMDNAGKCVSIVSISRTGEHGMCHARTRAALSGRR